MANIIIQKKNEIYLKVETEPHIHQELSEYFTFEVPGAKFMPQYRSKYWDGKIRLADLRSYTIYHGLVPYIQDFCKTREYTLDIDSSISNTNIFSVKEAEEFISTLKLPFEVRDYQLKSFVQSIRNKRLLLISPTASGKSLILYLILKNSAMK